MTVPGAGVPPDGGGAARAGRRRRLVPVLVALDAVLVAAVLVVVLLVTRPGGTLPTPDADGTGTQAVGGTTTPRPTATAGPPRFQLPSGNIACDMSAGGVTCTIASETFTPPPVADCSGGSVGHTVVLDAHGVSVPCVRGAASRPAGQVPVLDYGGSSTVGPYTCTSATNGVTCTTAQGVGFRLARQELVTLP